MAGVLRSFVALFRELLLELIDWDRPDMKRLSAGREPIGHRVLTVAVRLNLAADVLLILRHLHFMGVDMRRGDGAGVRQLRRYGPEVTAAGELARLVPDAVDARGTGLVLVPLILLRRRSSGCSPLASVRATGYARFTAPCLSLVRYPAGCSVSSPCTALSSCRNSGNSASSSCVQGSGVSPIQFSEMYPCRVIGIPRSIMYLSTGSVPARVLNSSVEGKKTPLRLVLLVVPVSVAIPYVLYLLLNGQALLAFDLLAEETANSFPRDRLHLAR